MYTGLKESSTEYLITRPCDGPFINESYFKKMILLESDSDINVAFDGKRLQPVYCLINKSLLGNLERFLQSGERKIDKWFELCSVNYIDFSNNKDLFININNEEDLNQHKEKIKNILNKNLNLEGKKVLLRVDLNVPMKNGAITETSRIQKIIPTIKLLIKKKYPI